MPNAEVEVDRRGRLCPEIQPVTVLIGRPGAGKTVACLDITDEQRVICLPTRLAILSMAQYARSRVQDTTTIANVFFSAGDDEGGAEISRAGAAFQPCDRNEACAADIVFVTPYQMRVQRFRPGALYIVDEAHECAVDRLAAISAIALRGDALLLASATPPPWLRGAHDLFGRPLEVYEIGSPSEQRVRLVRRFTAATRGGVTLQAFGNLMAAARAHKECAHPSVLLCGENSPADMAEALRRVASGEVQHVFATIGVCESSVTIPGVTRLAVHSSALRRHVYRPGRADSTPGPPTKLELTQLLGRCARDGPRVGEAILSNCETDTCASWAEALAASGFEVAPDAMQMRRQGFNQLLTVLGGALDQRTAEGVCALLATAPTLIAYLRACYAAMSTWIGQDLVAWSRKLSEEDALAFRFGQDRGRLQKATLAEPAGFFNTHNAFRDEDEKAVQPTRARVAGLVLLMGPGFSGAFSCSEAECPDSEAYRDLVGTFGTPTVAQLIPTECTVDGRAMQGEFPKIGCETVVAREAALVSGVTGEKVPAGLPMGSRANGSSVNAVTSCAALAARAICIAAGQTPARSGTGGDDILSEDSPFATEAMAICQAATQRKENDVKTRVVDWTRNFAVVLERYWRYDRGTPMEFLPPPCLTRLKGISATLLGAAPDLHDDAVSRACEKYLRSTAPSWGEHLALAQAETADPRLRTGVLNAGENGRQLVRLSRTFAACVADPGLAGRQSGSALTHVRRRLADLERCSRTLTEPRPLHSAGQQSLADPRKEFVVSVPSGTFSAADLARLSRHDLADDERRLLSQRLREALAAAEDEGSDAMSVSSEKSADEEVESDFDYEAFARGCSDDEY